MHIFVMYKLMQRSSALDLEHARAVGHHVRRELAREHADALAILPEVAEDDIGLHAQLKRTAWPRTSEMPMRSETEMLTDLSASPSLSTAATHRPPESGPDHHCSLQGERRRRSHNRTRHPNWPDG